MDSIAYIASISFQIAGALLLIIFSISTKRKNIIRAFAKSHIMTRNIDTGEIIYDHKAFVEVYRIAYYSKISVGLIAIGYMIGIFGNIGQGNKCCIAAIILITTIIIILIVWGIVCILLKKKTVQMRITNDELKNVGVEVNLEKSSPKSVGATLILGEMNVVKKD